MEENNWKVYIHLNKINKKAYFGITKQPLSRRFRKDGKGYQHCTYFYRAIQKYGWDNFQHIVLKENLSEQKAIGFEKWLISRYDTTNKNKGYNTSPGGQVIINSKQISLLNKQRWQQGIYNKIKQPVYCIELNKYFESALQAQRELKIDNSGIQKACKEKNKYAGIKQGQALHWLFQNNVTEENIKKLLNKKEILKGVSIPVYCLQLKKEFKSSRQASQQLKIDESSIRKACKGKIKSAGKDKNGNPLHWKQLRNKVNIGDFGSTGK